MDKCVIQVTQYDAGDGFIVEASTSINKTGDECVEFYLHHTDYGIKSLMFGVLTKDCPETHWELMIKNNLDNYIEIYKDEYMDEM